MGPNTFNLFCTLETIFAILAVATLFQAAPRLSSQAPTTATWYMILIIGSVVVHSAILIYNGIRREFSPLYVHPSIFIAYMAYGLWPFASSSSTSFLPWSWLLGIYGLLTPLCLYKAKATIANIIGLCLALYLSESLAATLNKVEHFNYQDALSDVLYLGALCTILGGLVSLSMNSAMHADTVYADTMSAHLRFNRNRDHAKELQEFDKLVHDNVMAALLDASRFEGEVADRTRALAQRAIKVLDEGTRKDIPHLPVTFQALTEQIAAGVSPWNSRLRFVIDPIHNFPKADPESIMPQEVARAFTHAVTEAVSNSARHSDSRVTHISIRTELRAPAKAGKAAAERPFIICTVSDKGQGFNVKALDLRRMGVRVSMLRSMEEAGGKVTIRSAPEKGTTVTVQWPNEEPYAR